MSDQKMNIINLITESKPEIRDATRKAYYYGIKRAAPAQVQKRLGVGMSTNPIPIKWITDTKSVLKRINQYNIPVQKTTITPLLVLTKHLYGEDSDSYVAYLSKSEEYNISVLEEQAKHIKSKSQDDNWVELQVLKDHVLTMPRDTPKQKMQRLVAALYTFQPPVRNDYGAMEIVTDLQGVDSDKNYLVRPSSYPPQEPYFYFQNFKTHRTVGNMKIDVTEEMQRELNLFLGANEVDIGRTSGYLFGEKKTKPRVSYALSQAFLPTGKHITLNLIRHVVATGMVDIEQAAEQEKIATSMMHSTKMQITYAKA